jgi:hypothetical protein
VLIATAGQDAGHTGVLFVRLFSFFTIQSNVLLLAAAVSLTLHAGRDGRFWRVLRLDAMLGIIITGLIYATVLAGTYPLTGAAYWAKGD